MQRKATKIFLNATYLHVAVGLLESIIYLNISSFDIVIIIFYIAQRTCYRKISKKKSLEISAIRSISVDQSQENKTLFFILCSITSNKEGFDLNFFKDL